jgi:hypothetical protein
MLSKLHTVFTSSVAGFGKSDATVYEDDGAARERRFRNLSREIVGDPDRAGAHLGENAYPSFFPSFNRLFAAVVGFGETAP